MTRAIALLLTTFTGMSGLVYEVTWERYLAILVGSHGEATAAVLGLFLGGLSMGYAGFGVITQRTLDRAPAGERRSRLLRLYGIVEAAIGVYALLFPLLFSAARFVSLHIPTGAVPETLVFGFDVLLCALLIVPGAFLMGATIPVLTQALANDLDDATRVHARIYAFNTFGAVFGALAGGFFLIPQLGLIGSLQAMAAINISVGAAFVWMAPRSGIAPEGIRAAAAAPAAESNLEGVRSYLAIALLTGFAMMTLQTVVIRMGGLAFGSSPYTFSVVVAVFVLGIASGSFAVGALPRVPKGAVAINLWIQVALLFGLYYVLEVFPWLVFLLRGLFTADTLHAFYAYEAASVQMMLVGVGPAAFFSGATLPLIFHELRDRLGDLGSIAGSLYSWNTVGSLLGALFGGYLLLFWLDLDGVFSAALAALLVAAALATVRGFGMPAWLMLAGTLPMLLAVVMLPSWRVAHLTAGLFRVRSAPPQAYETPNWLIETRNERTELFYDDDPVASIFVMEVAKALGTDQPSRSIVNNGKSDGNTFGDYLTMGLASILPAALNVDDPKRAFVIGFGTGVSAGELAALPTVEEVIVAEISPGVVEAAPLFDEYNLNVSTNPKVEILRSDAYRALLRAEGRFDVIVSEPSNPWMAGVDMLFTEEFLTAAKSRLSEGGIYLQWYHQYSTSNEAVAMVLRTYSKVFDRVAVWYGLGSDLFLLGINGDQPIATIPELRKKLLRPEYQQALRRLRLGSVAALFAHELVPEHVVGEAQLEGPIHTLTHPRLGYEAARAFYFGGTARMPLMELGARTAREKGRGISLFQQLVEEPGLSKKSVEARYANYVREMCRHRMPECVATLGRWTRVQPGSEIRQAMVRRAVRSRASMGTRFLPRDVARASELFLPLPENAPANLSVAHGKRMNDLFVDAFHHATPFDPEALLAVWDRCTLPSKEACEEGRLEAVEILEGRSEERGLRISLRTPPARRRAPQRVSRAEASEDEGRDAEAEMSDDDDEGTSGDGPLPPSDLLTQP